MLRNVLSLSKKKFKLELETQISDAADISNRS